MFSMTVRAFLLTICGCLLSGIASAQDDTFRVSPDAESTKSLYWFGSVAYGPREMGGTIFVNRYGPVSGIATPDTLGLDTAESFQFRLGAIYKRWRFMVDYLPTSYTGEGFAAVEIKVGDLPTIPAQTNVASDIDTDLLLLNVGYELLHTEKWVGAVGVGFGRTALDIALVPDVGQPLAFDGTTPFGYISGDIARHFGRWNMRLGIGWISAEFDGTRIDYGNYNASLAYVLTQDKFRSEIVAGYRQIDLKFDYNVPGERVLTDISLEGPYVGLIFAW